MKCNNDIYYICDNKYNNNNNVLIRKQCFIGNSGSK